MAQRAHQRDRRQSFTDVDGVLVLADGGKNRNVHPSVFDRPEPYVRAPRAVSRSAAE